MIKNSLKKTLSIIEKNKYRIILILLLQLTFFTTLSLISYKTINPAMQYAKKAVDYYDSINITEDSGMFGYLGEDPLIIYENYGKMMHYLKFTALFSILAVIILNGLLWAFTDNLANKKSLKQFLNYLLNFTILILAFILLFYILVFNTLKSSLAKLSLLPLVGISFLLIVLLYFLVISLSLIDKRKIKDITKLTFHTGIFNFPKIILIYLIDAAVILLSSYLLYLAIEANIILLILTLALFIFSFFITRLFTIIAVNELT